MWKFKADLYNFVGPILFCFWSKSIDRTVFIALSYRSMKTRIKALECVKSATNAEIKVNTTNDIQNTNREHKMHK